MGTGGYVIPYPYRSCQGKQSWYDTSMDIVNTETISGQEITAMLGVVRGSSVRAKWLGKDIIAGLRSLVGGELKEYEELLREARDHALERMVKNAEELGADAIVNVRFSTSAISPQAAEILVYGTAVTLSRVKR